MKSSSCATSFTSGTFIWVAAAFVALTAVGPAIAEIWGVKTQGPFSQPPSTLFRFDEDGGTPTVVGEIALEGLPVDVDGLAVDAEGAIYAFVPGDASGQLVIIDPVTAAASPVGMLSGREIRGATFTETGELIGVDMFESALVQVDPTTGQQMGLAVPLTLDGEPFSVGSGTDLAIDRSGVAVLSDGTLEIYEVNLETGAVTLLLEDAEPGEDGIQLYGAGVAFSTQPADQRLFLFDVNGDDDVFAYALEEPFERVLVYANIISSYNAGRGDLASFPSVPVAVPDGHGEAPERPRLLPNFPNPFNPHTTITFSVPSNEHVKIAVIDLAGRHLATLTDRDYAAGSYSVSWDGLDKRGRAMPSGTYLVRLKSRSGVEARKVMLAR